MCAPLFLLRDIENNLKRCFLYLTLAKSEGKVITPNIIIITSTIIFSSTILGRADGGLLISVKFGLEAVFGHLVGSLPQVS